MRATLAAAALFTLGASAATVDHFWNIEWVGPYNPDGLQPRAVIGVNGTWPPPPINVNASDFLRVHATNSLNTGAGASLHSHGMFFNHTGYYDGAVGITQCLIPPNNSLTYEVLNSPSASEGRARQYVSSSTLVENSMLQYRVC